jgi:hypothetical protein
LGVEVIMLERIKIWFKNFFCKKKDNKNYITVYNSILDDDRKVNFIYEAVKDKLQATIDSHSFLEKKIILFLSYLISVNTFLISYIISHVYFQAPNRIEHLNFQLIPLLQAVSSFYYPILIIIGLFSIMAIILIFFCLRPKKFYFKGNEFINLNTPEYSQGTINEIIIGEASRYDERIYHNQKITIRNRRIFKFFLVITIFSPILFLYGDAKILYHKMFVWVAELF